MRTMCSREIFTKKYRQQQIFDSDLKGAWHYNHVTFTPIAKNFMLYCRLIYVLSIRCVRLTINVKVGISESFRLRETAGVNLYHVTKLSPYFPFTLYFFYTEISSFTSVLTIGIVRDCFYVPIFVSRKAT